MNPRPLVVFRSSSLTETFNRSHFRKPRLNDSGAAISQRDLAATYDGGYYDDAAEVVDQYQRASDDASLASIPSVAALWPERVAER